MELIGGVSILDHVHSCDLDLASRLSLFTDICDSHADYMWDVKASKP